MFQKVSKGEPLGLPKQDFLQTLLTPNRQYQGTEIVGSETSSCIL